jgi:hypothetical protein
VGQKPPGESRVAINPDTLRGARECNLESPWPIVHICGGIKLDGCPGTLEHFIDAQAEYQETWQRGHR